LWSLGPPSGGRLPGIDAPGRIRYTFEAQTRYDKLFSGISVEPPPFIDLSDRSGRQNITPVDTFDADYSRLLAAAHRTLSAWRARQDPSLLARAAGRRALN
jgi:hypothetical protein